MRDIFIMKEMWEQDKIYILVGTLLGRNRLQRLKAGCVTFCRANSFPYLPNS
jgi:hypothetical protein